ncbi:hypothetical protein [Tautonia rosea]|uniref:hypothetical protein n=1 Tax=Tautonia rosea TaxID=2728037 RepID=UPI0014728805|nr:hypothetical protein [Tautonia rosea]
MSLLEAMNLLEAARSKSQKKKVFGGKTKEESEEHFTHRFCASATRIQNVVLDANDKFDDIPKDVLLTFSSHDVAILDIPSGHGASGLSLLSMIHELRAAKIIPQISLNVYLLAGDYSETSLELYREMIDRIGPELSRTGIEVHLETMLWDALDLVSTNRLCYRWEELAEGMTEGFVLVTNFSGDGKNLLDELSEQIRHISVRAEHNGSTILWVEPGDPGGRKFLARIGKAIASLFGSPAVEEKDIPMSEAKWWHELHECEHPVRSAVQQYVRPR